MSAEQPSVEALVERIAKELPNPSWAHAALDSLTAEIERLKGLLYAEQHGKHAEKWNELAAALERAERERDEARVYERQEARNYWIASRNEWKARAQKAEARIEVELELRKAAYVRIEQAEAVVEAAREYMEHTEDSHFRRGHFNTSCPPLTRAMCTQYMHLRRALTAYDEPPAQLYEWVALEGEARHALERAERERDAIRGEMRLLERERNDEQGKSARAEARAQKAEAERDDEIAHRWKAEAVVEAAREIRGYVRAHLAGNDADPELTWALEQADAALTAYDKPPTGEGGVT
jgi:hypothetical protein